jgi:hypothetical protein
MSLREITVQIFALQLYQSAIFLLYFNTESRYKLSASTECGRRHLCDVLFEMDVWNSTQIPVYINCTSLDYSNNNNGMKHYKNRRL